ncbi:MULTISPECIES: hypothetical protein [unclassified Campylobacter]|uniref:hypothetical protein n=1 Tax=unclassified Campylobacter TaxID=2593542 RepID=UPI0012898A9A|nr:hypothetical protein [Campylobacter sp. CNRCH_2014_2452]EAK9891632.1 hypothetical protein [Campylobacter lari]MCR8713033.1 hypothetical protein [Campylobacter sp. W0066.1]EGK8127671.1 hypothetical protein [Campylobacter lari]MCV3486566.1 hypothetical protein [Campylobacter sp. CNRCH_2014_2452]HEG2607456.1 hypothetical protein [Campylobacter lari]
MLKISKRISIIVFIVLVFIIIASNAYNFIQEALQFKEANENKARENLSALIKWSENEGKEELEYAKNLSKENYNQEKVTQMIIKNLKMIQTSIEDIRILTIYSFLDEDEELSRKASRIVLRINMDIILYLLDNEKTFIGHKTYFLFDKERFDALEDFLFFLNTRLEEDFLKKNDNDFEIIEIVTYINLLIGLDGAFANNMYLRELSIAPICDLNNPKTIAILNGIEKINIAVDRYINLINSKIKFIAYKDDYLKMKIENINNNYPKLRLDQKQINQLNTLQSKLKECKQ